MEKPVRKILHIDMDAFYASVEQRDQPELRGKPIVVGGSPDGRGVVCSASYEARRFGVRSAMPARRARELCPQAIFVRVDMARYKEASRHLQRIFREATEHVEPLSLDEAYLDVTVNLWGEPLGSRVVKRIRERIREELRLTASAGVGPNKFIAKLASDLRKPDALVVVPPERVAALLEQLPVEKLWGVGPATARKLHAAGFPTTREIRQAPPVVLMNLLGRFGKFVHELAHGIDDRPVRSERVAKSRGAESTFAVDLRELPVMRDVLRELAADVERSVRRTGKRGKTVTLKVRFHDFKTVTRSRTLDGGMDDAATMEAVCFELLQKAWGERRVPVRLLGISLSGFGGEAERDDEGQLSWEV